MGTQGKHHERMKAETEVIPNQTKEHQRLPTNHEKLEERRGTDSNLVVLRKNQLCQLLDVRLLTPEL